MTYKYFKSTLEVHKQGDEYIIKDLIKGELFRSNSGDKCARYLVDDHRGESVITFCNFVTETCGMAEGSEHNPRFINWK